MKNWNYKELVDSIESSYEEYISLGENPDHALARIFEDYYFYPEKSHIVENLITAVHTSKLRIEKLGFAYITEINFLKSYIEKYITDSLLFSELQKEESTNLKAEVNDLLEKFKIIEKKD